MERPALSISALTRAFASGEQDPEQVLARIYERIASLGKSPIWISLSEPGQALEALRAARERQARGESLPLFGIPFAVKDNIDVAGLPTTAGCPAFASVPPESAPVVARLIDAGAILIGKTNLDQFATGLVGTRTPYGAGSCVFDRRYVSGGSSSGSALAVAHSLCSFALGTDTAGSGRVPAAYNDLVGLKPSKGLLSTRGVVPACRSLDCVSVFATSVDDAARVLIQAQGFDAIDPYSRLPPPMRPQASESFVFGVPQPQQLEFFGNTAYPALFQQAIERCQAVGGRAKIIDLQPFLQAAALLYEGPWLAERYTAVGEFIEQHRSEVDPTVGAIVMGGKHVSASDAFRAQYKLATLQRAASALLAEVDVLLLPTAPTHYTLQEIESEPVLLNKNLGRYTNFVNLLDLAAIAVPAGFTDAGLPFGVTLMAQAWSEPALLQYAARFRGEQPSFNLESVPPPAEPTPPTVRAPAEILLAVAGAHLSGQPLNYQLTQRAGRLIKTCRTSSDYKFYALDGTVPPKPGLVFTPGANSSGIEVEIWSLSEAAFGSFVADVPAPMTIGTVTLDDGSRVKSFLCEPAALERSRDITVHGGWRAFLSSVQ